MSEAANTVTEKSDTWAWLKTLSQAEREAWRLAKPEGLPSADERNMPDEFPFGWYAMDFSDELAVGQVKSVRYFGQDLALWRGEDGAPRLTSAYCAHYGANMAIGGKVAGNDLECPFHAWRYDGQGVVTEIPYAKNIPPQARKKDCVPSWPVCEANGYVWMWYHPERVAPLWEIAPIPEYEDAGWVTSTKARWNVFTTLENIVDNAVDTAHFRYVHRTKNVPAYEFKFEGIHRWAIARATLGTPMGDVKAEIESRATAMGSGWTRFTGLLDTILIPAGIPIDRDQTQFLHRYIQTKSEIEGQKAGLARALIKDVCSQFDEDKFILDRHRRMERPLICDGDGPFSQSWRFTSQFYASKNKPLAAE